MSRVPPIALDALDPETRAAVDKGAKIMGFTPNDALVMAHSPAILKGMWALVAGVYGAGTVDPGLKRLVGEAASKAAGCFYCSAHAAHGAAEQGVAKEKIEAVWSFEDSPLFTDAERAAIGLAMKAGRVPNETDDADLAALRPHFSDAEIIEIVGVISMFGFLNRWNTTLGTVLEPKPLATVSSFDGVNEAP
ncbi:MAG: carboxymuconolactone decarboxylase family protein [Pseudomonadota bacterium]